MYNGVARSSYRQHSCDDVTKLGLCDWFTNELTDWRRRRRRRKEITYETLGLHLVQQGKQCFQRWNRCVRFKVVKSDSLGLEIC